MLRSLSIENFKSIKDKVNLSFLSKKDIPGITVKIAKENIFKLGIFYGANASGKSNLLNAIDTVYLMLLTPQTDANKLISFFTPFITTSDSPTILSLSFYFNKIRYDYSISYDNKIILKESMNYYPNGKKILFYSRSFKSQYSNTEIKFGKSLNFSNETKREITINTLNNHSVLSVCKKNNLKDDIKPFTLLYDFLNKSADIFYKNEENLIIDLEQELMFTYRDKKKYFFYLEMLKKADLNIRGYRPTYYQSNENTYFKGIKFQIYSKSNNFELSLHQQSQGTIEYLQLIQNLYNLINSDINSRIDELGEDLHYELLLFYLQSFLFNSNESQLFITSQEVALLIEDLFNDNRGLIWFAYKDSQTASSSYFRADKLKIHKNASLFNYYMRGKIGARPETGSFFINASVDISDENN